MTFDKIKSIVNGQLSVVQRKLRGFTLVELLVVITIISILTGASAVVYNNVRDKGRDSDRKQDLASIKGALALYFQDNGYYPCDTTPPVACGDTDFVSNETQPWIPGLVSGGYIQKLPFDPKQISQNVFNYFAGIFRKDVLKGEVASLQTVVRRPTGNGSIQQIESITGASAHWQAVDEDTSDGDTSYVSSVLSSGEQDKDTYTHAPMPAASSVSKVKVVAVAREFPGNAEAAVVVRLNGIELSGPSGFGIGSSYLQVSQEFLTKPGGGVWTEADVNAAEFGVIVKYKDSSPTARVTQVWMEVTYEPLAVTPPTVTTSAATSVGETSVALNGSANPNGAAATGWFRYSTTNPGTCNDTFGTRAPASGGTDLGSGTSAVAYFQGISALTGSTTYYFCAIASNSGGTAFGSVLSFSTTAPAPLAPTVDIKANSSDGPITVTSGDTVVLSWTVTNSPTSCSASGAWSGAKSTSGGTENIVVTASGTYTLTCTNAGGEGSDSVTVDVSAPPPASPPPAGAVSTYMYVVTSDRKSFVLWAQLENLNDPQINTKAGATCRDTAPSGSYNYCLKPEF